MRRGRPFALRLLAVCFALSLGPRQGDAAAPSCPPVPPVPRPGALAWEPYTLETFDGGKHAAELGRLWLPEDRTKSAGPLIQMAVVRLRATTREPGPPILFLAGGPGIPATGMGRVPVYYSLFERLRSVADVLLLDMRGTGLSSPNLEWRDERPLPVDVFTSERSALREITRRARACADHWRARGVDLNSYNSLAVAEDIDALRRALGQERLSLLGFSYGTEAALTLLRRHPSRVERVVLAGTRGPDHVLHLPAAKDLLLKKIAHLAAAQPGLDPPLPDLTGTVLALLARLKEQPMSVTVTHRPTGQRVTLRVGKFGVQAVLARLLGDGRALPLLPALVSSLSRGDTTLLAGQMDPLYNGFTSLSGMNLAVNAASGWSREREARVRREAKDAVLGGIDQFSQREIRRLLGVTDIGLALRAPLWSPAPALFLTGSLDGTTPPYQAEEARWGFPNSVHLIVQNGSHETLPAEAVQEVVTAFFAGEDVSGRRIALPPPRFLSLSEATGR